MNNFKNLSNYMKLAIFASIILVPFFASTSEEELNKVPQEIMNKITSYCSEDVARKFVKLSKREEINSALLAGYLDEQAKRVVKGGLSRIGMLSSPVFSLDDGLTEEEQKLYAQFHSVEHEDHYKEFHTSYCKILLNKLDLPFYLLQLTEPERLGGKYKQSQIRIVVDKSKIS